MCRFRARKLGKKAEDPTDVPSRPRRGEAFPPVFRAPGACRAGLRAPFLPLNTRERRPAPALVRLFRLPLSPSLPFRRKRLRTFLRGFFFALFRENPHDGWTFLPASYFLGIFLPFAFDFCTRLLLTCNLLLCKLKAQGRAERSTVRGDRQKPVGSAESSPRVPSTESRKLSGFFWTVGKRSTAGKGRSFGMAGGGGVSLPPA